MKTPPPYTDANLTYERLRRLKYVQLTPGECLVVLAVCCAFSFGIGVIVEMLRVLP
jgi:hypothetical protein